MHFDDISHIFSGFLNPLPFTSNFVNVLEKLNNIDIRWKCLITYVNMVLVFLIEKKRNRKDNKSTWDCVPQHFFFLADMYIHCINLVVPSLAISWFFFLSLVHRWCWSFYCRRLDNNVTFTNVVSCCWRVVVHTKIVLEHDTAAVGVLVFVDLSIR